MLREWWAIRKGTTRLQVPNPCQSTGLWYLQPTPITVRFMQAMVARITYEAIYQWDQTAWCVSSARTLHSSRHACIPMHILGWSTD